MMNTRKTQAQDKEDMLLDLYKIHAYNPNDAIGNPLTPFGNFCAGYEACQALNDKRIAELEENLSKTVNMSIELAKTIAELEEKLLVSEVDAKRYQRARLIGCAVLGTSALKNGTVERFQSIDLTIDNDIAKYPTRGEARKA